MTDCPGCHKPPPREFCWAGDFHCPLYFPPRWMSLVDLWRELRTLKDELGKEVSDG
jgi:hypothetical protein